MARTFPSVLNLQSATCRGGGARAPQQQRNRIALPLGENRITPTRGEKQFPIHQDMGPHGITVGRIDAPGLVSDFERDGRVAGMFDAGAGDHFGRSVEGTMPVPSRIVTNWSQATDE